MSTVNHDDVVLLAPEEGAVPESAEHARLVCFLAAGLHARFRSRPDVAVHERLPWFPDRTSPHIRLDPDILVAFGRPAATRSCYRSWAEEGVPPTIIFEVRSDAGADRDPASGFQRARRYGVEEVVLVSPFTPGGVRVEHLVVDPADTTRFRIRALSGRAEDVIVLDRLGITMAGGRDLLVRDERGLWPDTATAFAAMREQQERADTAEARAERLAAQLRAAGIEPA